MKTSNVTVVLLAAFLAISQTRCRDTTGKIGYGEKQTAVFSRGGSRAQTASRRARRQIAAEQSSQSSARMDLRTLFTHLAASKSEYQVRRARRVYYKTNATLVRGVHKSSSPETAVVVPVFSVEPPPSADALLAADAQIFGLNLANMERIEEGGTNIIGYVGGGISISRQNVTGRLLYTNGNVIYQPGVSLTEPISDLVAQAMAEELAEQLGVPADEIDLNNIRIRRSKLVVYSGAANRVVKSTEVSTSVIFYRVFGGYPVYGSIFAVDFSNEGEVEYLELGWRLRAGLAGRVELQNADEMRDEALNRYTFPGEIVTVGHDEVVYYDTRALGQQYFQPVWLSFMAVEGYSFPFAVHVPAGKVVYPDDIDLYSAQFR